MNSTYALPDWTDLADLADEQVPLLRSALLIAHDEYPDLDIAACEAIAMSNRCARKWRKSPAAR
jgi:hypothetical protein